MSRYDLTDFEWRVIEPLLPNKPRGVPRVDDRRVLNGIFWVLRSGAPWRDLPERYGPRTTCYNRFVRWRKTVPASVGVTRRVVRSSSLTPSRASRLATMRETDGCETPNSRATREKLPVSADRMKAESSRRRSLIRYLYKSYSDSPSTGGAADKSSLGMGGEPARPPKDVVVFASKPRNRACFHE